MTFQQWYDKYQIQFERIGNTICLQDNEIYGDKRIAIYELTDYTVSLVENNVLWLVKKHDF